MQPILSIRNLVKHFGGLTVTNHVDLDLLPGELHAIIGPNGAGKTTLVNQIVGEVVSDDGQILLQGQALQGTSVAHRARLGISRSYQITSVIPEFTVLENVVLAAQGVRGHSYRFWKPAVESSELTQYADIAVDQVGLSNLRDCYVLALSYGQRRQLEIAMALAMRPKVLLLDEPTAGMGSAESALIADLLRKLKGSYSILLIEHDMDVVFSLADRISVLCYGKVLYCGDSVSVRNSPVVREAYLGDEDVAA